MSVLDCIAIGLLLIGGLNWALVTLFSVDFVATLFGALGPATMLVYLLARNKSSAMRERRYLVGWFSASARRAQTTRLPNFK